MDMSGPCFSEASPALKGAARSFEALNENCMMNFRLELVQKSTEIQLTGANAPTFLFVTMGVQGCVSRGMEQTATGQNVMQHGDGEQRTKT